MIERLYPADRDAWLELRRRFVGGSEVGALFDVAPYLTRYALWAEKSGLIETTGRETSAMRRGRYIERLAPMVLADERPSWRVAPNVIGDGGVYLADREHGIGCTPDLFADDPKRGPGIVEVKSASAHSFRRQWLDDDGAPSCPPWIALQATMEAALSGAHWAAVLLIFGDDFEALVFDIDLSLGVMSAIEREAASFWRFVEAGQPPPLDYDRDLALVKRLHPGAAEPLIELDPDPDLVAACDDFLTCKREIGLLKDRVERAETRLREALGNHAGATCGDYRLSAKVTTRKAYVKEFPATSYRTLRIKSATRKEDDPDE